MSPYPHLHRKCDGLGEAGQARQSHGRHAKTSSQTRARGARSARLSCAGSWPHRWLAVLFRAFICPVPVTCSALASGLALALRRSRRAGSKTRKHPVNDLLSTRQWGPRARVEVGQGSPHKYLQLYKDRDHRLRGDSLGSQHDLASVCCCPPAAGGFPLPCVAPLPD